jgi:hypothetical protein
MNALNPNYSSFHVFEPHLLCPHPQPLSQFWERGANSLVPLLPIWEKGLGDEGKTLKQSRFSLKLTPMSIAVPLPRGLFT